VKENDKQKNRSGEIISITQVHSVVKFKDDRTNFAGG